MVPESASVGTQDACEAEQRVTISESTSSELSITWQACPLELDYESIVEETRPEGQVQTVFSKVKRHLLGRTGTR